MQELQTEDLRAFCEIVRLGSLSAAARGLSTSVSSISRRLQRLESTVGRSLIERSTRRLAVTDEGHAFFERATDVLDRLEALAAPPADQGASARGKVRVLAPTLLSEYAFSQLGALLDAHPDLALEWQPTDRPSAEELLHADLIVQLGAPQMDSPLIARRIGEVWGCLAAAPAYAKGHGLPRRLSELAEHRLLRFRGERTQDALTLLDRFGSPHHVPVAGSFESSSSSALREALYAGAGIGFVSEPELEPAITRGALIRVLPTYRTPSGELFVLYAASRRRLPRVRVVIDWLERALA